MNRVALDTSVAVPLVMRSHTAHRVVTDRLAGQTPVLTAHSLAETYSVLTRLPADARVAPKDAVLLLDDAMGSPVLLEAESAEALHHILDERGIAGGAVYDALVGLAARDADLPLATRDVRARSTYVTLGVEVRLLIDE